MRSAVIHGLLLVVMLIYAYRTWTRDKSTKFDFGSVVLWDKKEGDLAFMQYKSDKKDLKIERRGEGDSAYWWAVETTTEKRIKPPEPKKPPEPGPGSGSGSGSGAGSGSAAKAEAPKPGSGSGSGSAVASTKPPAEAPKAGSGSAAGSGSGSAVAKTEPPKTEPPKAGSGSGSAAAKAEPPKPAAGSGSAGSGSAVAKAAGSGSAGSGSGSAGSGSAVAAAGSGSGSGSAATPPPPPPVEETITKTREYPLGKEGDELVESYFSARALRDLGVANDDMKKQYKLDTSKSTLLVTFKDGSKRTFQIGTSVSNDAVRYGLDTDNNHIYILTKKMIGGFELGESIIHLTDARGVDDKKLETVVIEAGGKTKTATKVQRPVEEGQATAQVKTWGDADTGKPNATLEGFINGLTNLRPTEYAPKLSISGLTPIMKATFKEANGSTMGTLQLFKGEKPGELPEGQELDPANPPKGTTVYYILTEKTHVPAIVPNPNALTTENNLPNVFSDNPEPPPGQKPPAKNPFGNVPMPPSHGAPPGGGTPPPGGAPPANPHGGLTPPAPGPTPPAPPHP